MSKSPLHPSSKHATSPNPTLTPFATFISSRPTLCAIASATIYVSACYFKHRLTLISINPSSLPLVALQLVILAFEVFNTVWNICSYQDQLMHARVDKPAPQMPPDDSTWPSVDVLIPCCNELTDVVLDTIRAVMVLDYPPQKFTVCVLDDGDNQQLRDFINEESAAAGPVLRYIKRKKLPGKPHYGKAGNLNHALSVTTGEFCLIMDADQIADSRMLVELLPYLVQESKCAYVLSPQSFYNVPPLDPMYQNTQYQYDATFVYREESRAVPSCGTGVVYRRTALAQVNNFCIETIEDYPTCLSMHTLGWHSHYHPRRLQFGLVPNNISAYTQQRQRWTLGNMEIIGKWWPLYSPRSSLPLKVRFNYLYAALYYVMNFGLTAHLSILLAAHLAGLDWAGLATAGLERQHVLDLLKWVVAKCSCEWILQWATHHAVATPFRMVDRVRYMLYLYWSGPLTFPSLVSYLFPCVKLNFKNTNSELQQMRLLHSAFTNMRILASHIAMLSVSVAVMATRGIPMVTRGADAANSATCGRQLVDLAGVYAAFWCVLAYAQPLCYAAMPPAQADPDRQLNLGYGKDGVPRVRRAGMAQMCKGAWVLASYDLVYLTPVIVWMGAWMLGQREGLLGMIGC